MDLFENKKETVEGAEEQQSYTHEQLSLDFKLESEAVPEPISKAPEKAKVKPDDSVKKAKKKDKHSKKNDLKEVYLDIGVGSFGKYLQDMRVKNDYSIAQVEQITRIKKKYIELLEMEKLRLELPSVYVLAYARKLCACYKVPVNEAESILNELKSKLDSSIPPDLIDNIHIDYEIDEENKKKMQHFIWMLLGVILLFAALIGIAIFMLSAPEKEDDIDNSGQLVPVEKFDQEKLRALQAPVIIEATELPPK